MPGGYFGSWLGGGSGSGGGAAGALTAGDAIEGARDRHPAFHEERTPDVLLFRELTRYVKALTAKITQLNPGVLAQPFTVTFPLADFAAGAPLPGPSLQLLRAFGRFASDSADPVPVHLINPGAQQDPVPYYSAWLQNGTLYFRGNAADWTGIVSVTFDYVPTPGVVAALTDTLALPPEAEAPVTERLALFMAQRGAADESLPPLKVPDFQTAFATAESQFLLGISMQRAHEESTVREVW